MARLSERHRKELAGDSAIGPAQIDLRGYRTISKPHKLAKYGFRPSVVSVPGLLIPSYAPDGAVSGHQFKPDKPHQDRPKYETPAGKAVRLGCPPGPSQQLDDFTVPLWITEGVKKADAATTAGLCCVSVQGVDCWRGTRPDGFKGPLPEWDQIPLADRPVYIAYDSDAMTKDSVRLALDSLTRFLTLRGARVRWVLIPGREGLAGAEKVGLDDWLAAEGTVDELLDLSVRPEAAIRVDGRDLSDLTRDAIAALVRSNVPPTLFQREGTLAEAQVQGVVPVNKDRMRFLLGETASWFKVVKAGKSTSRKPVDPPWNVISNVLAAGPPLWPFPYLDRIVTTPVFAKDGTLRTEPGYHPSSRSLYLPPDGLVIPPVSTAPTKKEVKTAKALITELFQDFVFVGEADRAHAWAMLLQPFAREMIRGSTPLYSVEAPKQGTGKTLLVHSALAPAVGEVDSFAEPHGDEEMDKRLTAAFMEASPAFFVDNVDRFINYPSLASALTKASWTGRVLGKSATTTTLVNATFVLTANNPRYSSELGRRIAPIRLDARTENPYDRRDFALSLPAWALQNRGRLVWAACTVLSAWVAAERPGVPDAMPVLGSFGPWRRVLGGALNLHGITGFLTNLPGADDTEVSPDHETFEVVAEAALESFDQGWFFAGDLATNLWSDDYEAPALHGNSPEQLSQSLGYFLRSHKGQIIKGHVLERATKDQRRRGGFPWRFAPVSD